MKYIKKRYRVFYLVPFTISIVAFCIMQVAKFILTGLVPEIQDVTVSIEGFEGEYYKVYTESSGKSYKGEKLEKIN